MIKDWAILEKFNHLYFDYLSNKVYSSEMIHIGYGRLDIESKILTIKDNINLIKKNDGKKQEFSNPLRQLRGRSGSENI